MKVEVIDRTFPPALVTGIVGAALLLAPMRGPGGGTTDSVWYLAVCPAPV